MGISIFLKIGMGKLLETLYTILNVKMLVYEITLCNKHIENSLQLPNGIVPFSVCAGAVLLHLKPHSDNSEGTLLC